MMVHQKICATLRIEMVALFSEHLRRYLQLTL